MRLLRLLFTLAVGAVITAAGVGYATTAAVEAVPAVDPLDAVEPVLARLSDAPPLPEMPERAPERSVMLAADGSVLNYLVGAENRVRLSRDEIPDTFIDALLAAEDDRFYEHRGVDLAGIARAYLRNVEAGEIKEGGSTITQQLVENTILPDARTYKKKIEEAWYAVQLEQELSKDEILQRYLNRVYFGEGAYGIAAAAERYFSAQVNELRVDQVAMLIGIVRAPSALNPIDNPDGAREVRDLVLGRLEETGRLSALDARAARGRALDLDPKEPPKPRYPFFAEYVRHQLLTSRQFDHVLGTEREQREALVYGGGLRIHTTLRPKLQRAADRAIRKVVKKGKRPPQSVVVTVRPGTGNVQAMAVGPRLFGECTKPNKRACKHTMVNPAVQGLGGSGRQPGSAFKPFVAAAALEQGIPRGWEMETEGGKRIPGCRDGNKAYKPHNYSPSPGVKDMTEAMRVSNNVYFAKLAGEVGPRRVVRTAKAMGLRGANLPEGCAVALGSGSVTPLEMANSFATFAANGRYCQPRAVVRIERRGNEHTFDKRCERVLPAGVAKTVTSLLREPVEGGTATAVNLNRQVAGKTGTTQDYRDAWFVGYVRQMATATWIGYEQPAPLRNVLGRDQITGGSAPAELFTAAMKRMLRGVDRKPLPSPEVRQLQVPRLRGQRLAEVRRDLDYELQLDVVRVRHHRPRGTIVRQSPKPGARVSAGATITVGVSNGQAESPRERRAKQRAEQRRARQEARQAQRRAERQAEAEAEAAEDARAEEREREQRERDRKRDDTPEPSEEQPRRERPKPDPEPTRESRPEPEPEESESEPEPEPTEEESDPEPEPTEPEPTEPEPTEPEPTEPEPEPEPSESEPEPEPEPSESEPEPEPTDDATES